MSAKYIKTNSVKGRTKTHKKKDYHHQIYVVRVMSTYYWGSYTVGAILYCEVSPFPMSGSLIYTVQENCNFLQILSASQKSIKYARVLRNNSGGESISCSILHIFEISSFPMYCRM